MLLCILKKYYKNVTNILSNNHFYFEKVKLNVSQIIIIIWLKVSSVCIHEHNEKIAKIEE